MLKTLTPEIVLLTLLILASVNDWRHRKIPNLLVGLGMAAGMSLMWFAGGASAVGQALFGAVIGLAIYLPLYVLRWVGAGDAKLMAMVGCFVGPVGVAWSALYSFIAGGILGVLMLLIHGGWASTIEKVVRLFNSLVLRARGVAIPMPIASGSRAQRLPYALAIFAGTASWLWLSGGLAQIFMA